MVAKAERIEKVVRARLGDVVVDPSYQTRMSINNLRVREYADCMRMGDSFPPIVIEKQTMKVVCGFTRMEAYKDVFEPNHKIPVTTRLFADDKERILFAVADNRNHGEPFSVFDKKNLVCRLLQLKLPENVISKTLGWPLSKVGTLAGTVVVTFDGKKKKGKKGKNVTTIPASKVTVDEEEVKQSPLSSYCTVNGEAQALKGGLGHRNGTEISEEVYKNIAEHYVGWSGLFIIDQLIMRIDDGMLDLKHKKTVARLRLLCKKIRKIVGK